MHTLWKTAEGTCANQQLELQNYRQHMPESSAVAKLRREFAAASQTYKVTISELKRRLQQQEEENAKLSESKAHVVRSLSEIESTYKSGVGRMRNVDI